MSGSSADRPAPMRTPTRRIRSGCCASEASGHAAAPLTSAMNSRRLMSGFPLSSRFRRTLSLHLSRGNVLGLDLNCSELALAVGPIRSSLPTHQLLGGLLVVLEEFAVILALDDLGVERQGLGLGLVLLRADGLLQITDQGGLDLLWQAGRRGDAARHRPHLVEALLAKCWPVGNERRALG